MNTPKMNLHKVDPKELIPHNGNGRDFAIHRLLKLNRMFSFNKEYFTGSCKLFFSPDLSKINQYGKYSDFVYNVFLDYTDENTQQKINKFICSIKSEKENFFNTTFNNEAFNFRFTPSFYNGEREFSVFENTITISFEDSLKLETESLFTFSDTDINFLKQNYPSHYVLATHILTQLATLVAENYRLGFYSPSNYYDISEFLNVKVDDHLKIFFDKTNITNNEHGLLHKEFKYHHNSISTIDYSHHYDNSGIIIASTNTSINTISHDNHNIPNEIDNYENNEPTDDLRNHKKKVAESYSSQKQIWQNNVYTLYHQEISRFMGIPNRYFRSVDPINKNNLKLPPKEYHDNLDKPIIKSKNDENKSNE